ncbi:MAG: glutamine synthetase III [Proteobacteria bacterium]|nr:glutamine synthetase III [Pseudomonadota bacterium]
MSGSSARAAAITAITNQAPTRNKPGIEKAPLSEIFASHVFSVKVMRERLPEQVFQSVVKAMENRTSLPKEHADVVATAMKDWAIEKGATHYSHVFYPLTGLTAEKHDSFLCPDGQGGVLEAFSGQTLIQGEPDASSFPNGGLRETFEARGYTLWDVTSPAYLMESPNGLTLCIPTMFISWNGEALDKKTPILRSMQALNKQAARVLKLLGKEPAGFISPSVGAEQEYFLIDRNFFFARPDLVSAGRTLFGARPSKGQEFADQYFGAIPERVLAFMMDVDRELFKLGIPSKTRHNEGAPGQYEFAPVYENANVAADHQQLVMVTLKSVARRHGMECLLHEKPFKTFNGSGKHLNWSLGNPALGNLLDPGDTPEENMQFLIFLMAMLRAVHRNAALLRATTASASNDHRLGVHEAPPTIISVYLGDQLTDIVQQLRAGKGVTAKKAPPLQLGVDTLPPIPRDTGDRNRTSPFAFTGDRFELRAVGSSHSISGALVALNTIAADALDYVATTLKRYLKKESGDINKAVTTLLAQMAKAHAPIVFNDDNYSDDWRREAERRGLPNYANTVDALPELTHRDNIAMFEKHNVLSKKELESRQHIYLSHYVHSLKVEANLILRMGKTMIFPAAVRYQSELARTCADLKVVGYTFDTNTLDRMTALVKQLQDAIEKLERIMTEGLEVPPSEEARFYRDNILPTADDVRCIADQLELLVADDLWPLPTYHEMLFIQ